MERFESSAKNEDVVSMSSLIEVPVDSVESFRGTREQLKDYLFDGYMKQQLLTDFFESLGGYLGDEEIDEVRDVLTEYSDKEVYAALSLPHELRERKFEEFEKNIAAGSSVSDVVRKFVDVSNRYEFGIGYHTSPVDIRPDEKGQWMIKGTEADHRDDDLMMAYYSTQYRHLFKKRDPKFIYIVRTEPSTHKTDGNWSRASSLSVVGRVPYSDVISYVEDTVNEKTATEQQSAAA